jgi:hypothetical protein
VLSDLVVYLEVRRSDQEFAVGCAVVLDVSVDVLYGPWDYAPLPSAALPVHCVSLPRARLPIRYNTGIVTLYSRHNRQILYIRAYSIQRLCLVSSFPSHL